METPFYSAVYSEKMLMSKIIIKKTINGRIKYEVLPAEWLVGEYETDGKAARALRALLRENSDATAPDETVDWMVRNNPYNPNDWKTVPIWLCENCGAQQNEYIHFPLKVVLKNDPAKRTKWICSACHKHLTREKQIEMEYK